MDRLLRSWLALAAVGAGIVHIALAWAATARVVDVPPVAEVAVTVTIGLTVVGIAELAWGLVALITDRLVGPGAARWAALAPVAGWALLLVSGALAGGLELPFLPMGTATLFDLFIAAGLSARLRTERAAPSRTVASGSAPMHPAFPLGLIAAGLVVSALVAPALSETVSWRGLAPATQTITPEHGSH